MGEAPSYEYLQERLNSPQFGTPPAEPAFELLKDEDEELSFHLIMRKFRQVHFRAGSNVVAGAFVMLFVLTIATILTGAFLTNQDWQSNRLQVLLAQFVMLSVLFLIALVLFLGGLRRLTLVQQIEVGPGRVTLAQSSKLGTRTREIADPRIAVSREPILGAYRVVGDQLRVVDSRGAAFTFGEELSEHSQLWLLARMSSILGPGSLQSASES